MNRTLPWILLPMLLVSSQAATGGPDAFGYTWVDSLEPVGGPAYLGVDISGTGILIVDGDDTGTPVLLFGPGIEIYGALRTELVMSTNGYLSSQIVDAGDDFTNDCPLPAPPSHGGGLRLYPLHDDLELLAGVAGCYHQYFAACPRAADRGPNTGCNIFMWDNAEGYPSTGTAGFDFWVYIYDNYDIVYTYGSGNPGAGRWSTTGIQNETATTGLTVACETAASIPGGYAVLIRHPPFGCGICGDCDGSGTGPDVLDALNAAQVAVGMTVLSPPQAACCDVDVSSQVDVIDALLMAQSAVGLPILLVCT